MPQPILGAAMDAFAAGSATAVAAVIVGTFLLRWYRMRQEFILMRLALEKGMVPLPPGQPQWLISLRQGVMTMALGLGLASLGAAGWQLAAKVPQPPVMAETSAQATVMPPAPRDERPGSRSPPPPPHPHDPAFESWQRAQAQTSICMVMVASGGILILLGLIRLTFVPVERRFAITTSTLTDQRNQP